MLTPTAVKRLVSTFGITSPELIKFFTGGGFESHGTLDEPARVGADVSLKPSRSVSMQLHFVRSVSGLQDVTASPQIAPGTLVGGLLLLTGTSDTHVPTFKEAGDGVTLNGDLIMDSSQVVLLFWNGARWSEICRAF